MEVIEYEKTEVGAIPSDWKVTQLRDIAEVVSGGTPSTNNSDYWAGQINWFTPTEIGEHKYSTKSRRRITKAGLENSSAKLLPIGSILMTSRASIGDLSILREPAATNQGFQSLVAKQKIHNEYLYYAMQLRQSQLIRNASGSTFLEISPEKVRSISIPIPSTLREQKAIATALSHVDALIQKLDDLIEKKQAIKKATMQLLLTGKKRLDGFGGEWEERKLGDIAEVDPENLSSNTNADYEFQYITLENVSKGTIKNTVSLRYSEAPSRARRIVRKNDIGFGTVRPNLQSHFIINKQVKDVICSTGFAVIRGNENEVESRFLFYNLFADNMDKQINQIIAGSNYPAINSSDVKELSIKLPPDLKEQSSIVRIIEDMDMEIKTTNERQTKYKKIKQGMMNELLTGKIRFYG